MNGNQILFGLLIFAVLIFLYEFMHYEGFSSRSEKASAIFDWFKSGGRSYKSYLHKVPTGDIVEFHDAKKLLVGGIAKSPSALYGIISAP